MTPTDDESTLRRFREGDPEAFRALIERYRPLLERRAERRMGQALRRKLSVTDVVQETQVVAFESRAAFESRGPRAFRNWLLGILDNRIRQACDGLRRQKRDLAREVTRGQRPDTVLLEGALPSPSEMAMGEELRARTWAAIEALPEQYRDVLRLVHRERLDLETVAERIGRSLAATRKLHARALLRLSDRLRVNGSGPDR